MSGAIVRALYEFEQQAQIFHTFWGNNSERWKLCRSNFSRWEKARWFMNVLCIHLLFKSFRKCGIMFSLESRKLRTVKKNVGAKRRTTHYRSRYEPAAPSWIQKSSFIVWHCCARDSIHIIMDIERIHTTTVRSPIKFKSCFAALTSVSPHVFNCC